jgi:hypothetical protein
VLTQQDFGVFQDYGYRGLYAGEAAADIHLRKGLKKGPAHPRLDGQRRAGRQSVPR